VDTLVAVEGRVLGKPGGEEQARQYLTLLSGRTHTVHSGLCLRLDGVEHVRHAATDVTFAALESSDVDWYLGTGEWRDRAGGYAVQGRGAALVRSIAGDYQNVVGLPVAALIDVMAVAAVR
ncbi:MAG TPA: Maf family protein, partial [Solirubrobacteraceae bacterium]